MPGAGRGAQAARLTRDLGEAPWKKAKTARASKFLLHLPDRSEKKSQPGTRLTSHFKNFSTNTAGNGKLLKRSEEWMDINYVLKRITVCRNRYLHSGETGQIPPSLRRHEG